MNEAEIIESVAGLIERYLRLRPNSADTLEGVHRWWIDWGDKEEAPDVTEQALHLLEARGAVQRCLIGERCLWRRPPSSP